MIIVVGQPFSGKARYAAAEVARQEEDGRLGLVVADWTRIYSAIVPGQQSALRDEQLQATGAARLAGAIYDRTVSEIATRELDGYVLTQSPRRAVALADRLGATEIVETQADESQLADRMDAHLDTLRAAVRRAAREESEGRCLRAAIAYWRERDGLAGRARGVRLKRRQWESTGPVRRFNRALWLAGLTAGRAPGARRAGGGRQPRAEPRRCHEVAGEATMITITEAQPGQLAASLARLRERIKTEAVAAIQRKGGAMGKALREDAISTRAAASVQVEDLQGGDARHDWRAGGEAARGGLPDTGRQVDHPQGVRHRPFQAAAETGAMSS